MEDEISKRCLSTEDIYDIVDGEASEEISSAFAEHIKGCEKCRQEYENIKKLKSALRDCTSEPSADFAKNTLARLKTVERNPFIRITGTRTFKTVTAVAACLVLVFIVCGRGILDTLGDSAAEEEAGNKLYTVSKDDEHYLADTASLDDSLYAAYDGDSAEDAVNGISDLSDDGTDSLTTYSEVPEEEKTGETEPYTEPEAPAKSMPTAEGPVVEEPVVEEPVAEEPTVEEPVFYEAPLSFPGTSDSGSDFSSSDSGGGQQNSAASSGSSTENSAVTQPHACDAFSNDPEIPEVIYLPTALLDSVTVTSALYDHETTVIDTENGIYFTVYENETALSQYRQIQEKYDQRPSEEAAVTEEPVIEEPVTEESSELPVQEEPAVDPEEPVAVEPMAPADIKYYADIVDGIYIVGEDWEPNFTIYWFADEHFYKLTLPIEYRDGNEIRFTSVTEIENPAK